MSVISINKLEGETPLECLDRLRADRPELRERSLTYLGRLDPMAEGLLLVGVDSDQSEREEILALPKTYLLTVLFGFQSDTYDILGIPFRDEVDAELTLSALREKVAALRGSFRQPYPPYSSRTAVGKDGKKQPLFMLARNGNLPEELPSHAVTVHSAHICGTLCTRGDALRADIERRIEMVKGDFRQQEILGEWKRLLGSAPGREFDLATIELEVGSGTYVRGIAHALGHALGTYALAYRIRRRSIGEWCVE